MLISGKLIGIGKYNKVSNDERPGGRHCYFNKRFKIGFNELGQVRSES